MKIISRVVLIACLASAALAGGLRGGPRSLDTMTSDYDDAARRLGRKQRVPLSVDDPRWSAPRSDGRCGPKYGFAGCDPASDAPCCNYHRKTAKCGSSRRYCNSVGRRAWGVDFRLAMEVDATPPPTTTTQPTPTPKPTPKPTPTPDTDDAFAGLRPLDRIEAENRAKFAKGSKIKLSAKKPAGLGLAKACCATADVLTTVMWSAWAEPALAAAEERAVVVPCNTEVVLDMQPSADLTHGLEIRGTLSVLNDAQFEAEVRTGYVHNCGHLAVGTAAEPFAGKLAFTLVGATELPGFGFKAFATNGGLTELYGSACGATTWTTLAATAAAGSDRLVLAEPVAWSAGDVIVVASTGYSEDETERRTLAALEDGGLTAVLSSPLENVHGGVAPITAEVMSLTRNIVIQGEAECAEPNNALSVEAGKCGHFVINHTPRAHQVCGVEVTRMGQALTTGRYPMHMHFNGKAPGIAIRSNSIHDNFQRGVVIHATSDILVEENVVLKSRGHLLMTEDSLEEGNVIRRNVIGQTVPRDAKYRVGPGKKNAACAYLTDAKRKPLRALKAGEWGSCEWHRCSHGTGVYADVCGFRHDDYIGTAAIWLSNPNNVLEGNRMFVSKVDAAIRLENRGVTGLSKDLPRAVIAKAIPGPSNFKSKKPAAGFVKGNVVHSSSKGLKNYPHYTPQGGVVIEDMTVWKSQTGVFTKNGFKYTNDSPYFEDGEDGRTSQRYTIRGATLIGNKVALQTINNPTKQHTERSVIAATPPASLYPEAAADAYCGKAFLSKYTIGNEGKHLPKGVDTWSITVDDATLAVARAGGFRTRAELEAEGVPFHAHGYPNVSGKRNPWNAKGPKPAVMFTGNVNQFYQRATCGARGKVGPACYRPAFVFPKPAAVVDAEVEDFEQEMEGEVF